MCRDDRERWRAAGHWLLQANLGQVSEVMAALQGSSIAAPQLLAVAERNGITLSRMAQPKVSEPSQRIDAVEVYKLYRTLLKNDQLASRATVESWLKSWGVAHVP